MSRRLHKPLWAVAALLCVNAVSSSRSRRSALPQGLEDFLFGPKLVRAEVILQDAGGVHDYRVDRGRVRTVSRRRDRPPRARRHAWSRSRSRQRPRSFKERRVPIARAPARHDRRRPCDSATRRRTRCTRAMSQPAPLESTGRLEPAFGPTRPRRRGRARDRPARSAATSSATATASSGSGPARTRSPSSRAIRVRIVVLDIGLPGIDGFDVCREIRARSTVPIVMLTARDEETDRVARARGRRRRLRREAVLAARADAADEGGAAPDGRPAPARRRSRSATSCSAATRAR